MRILSGFQPSGTLHLGNYFGAMLPNLEFQKLGESYLFIADYHALTTSPTPEDLRQRVFDVALDFLACGLDVDHTVFFRQSDVPEVTELMWILNTITTVGFLERAHADSGGAAQTAVSHDVVKFLEADLPAVQIIAVGLIVQQQGQRLHADIQFFCHLSRQVAAAVSHNHKISHLSRAPFLPWIFSFLHNKKTCY